MLPAPEVDVDLDARIAGKRVLLAEDDASARRALAKAMRDMGLDVLEVDDGGRMLVAVTAHYKSGHTPAELDLIVTDVQMPVFSGIDVFKGLRQARWRTPVIVMTAYPDSKEVRDAVNLLDAVLLAKPLDLDAFEELVRDLLLWAGTAAPRG
jgi:CheY-like chemotaxis protein